MFGAPLLEGTLSGTDLRVGDFVLPAVKLDAERSGDTTAWSLSAELAAGALAARGTLARTAGAYLATIEALQISAESVEAQLAAPFEVAVGDGQVTVSEGVLEAGSGRLALSGQFGDGLAIQAQMDALPLAILNPFQPDLEASGTLFGAIAASGTAIMPEVTFDLEARDVSFALLQLTGIDPLLAEAEGSYAAGTLSVDAEATISGRVVSLRGDIGEELDATVGIDELPLSLVDAVAPQLELGGTLSARLHATGSLADPQANFELNGADLTLAQLRAAGVPGVDLFATGRFEDTAVELSEAVVSLDGGRVELRGTVGEVLDLEFGINDLPLSLAGGQLPELGLEGTLSGSGTATGAALDPQVAFDLRGKDIATAQMRAAGAPRIEVSAQGTYAAGLAQLSEAVASIGEGRIELAGTVGSELDVGATVTELPLAIVGALLPIELEGSLSGTAQASGRLLDPRASFDLRGEGITTPELRSDELPALALSLRGSYAAETATLTEAVVAAGEGRLSVSGTVGSEIDLVRHGGGLPALDRARR